MSHKFSLYASKICRQLPPRRLSSSFFTNRCFSTIPRVLLEQTPTKISQLPNGLRVASHYVPGSLATVGVFVDSGSRYETPETNGVAHFLEHLIFKGTRKRSRIQLEKEVENMGGHLNAYTAREQTVYYAKVFRQDLSQATEILSDIVLNSQLTQSSIEEERYVILREMEEVAKNLEEVIFDRLHTIAYPQSSLGYTILGPPRHIQTMKRPWLENYIQKNYTANRLILVGVGDFDHDTFASLVSTHFKKVRPTPSMSALPQERLHKPVFTPGHWFQNEESLSETHCALSWESAGWSDSIQPIFMILQQLIGSRDFNSEDVSLGVTSKNRMFHELSSSSSVHSYSGFNTSYRETGLFGLYFVCSPYAIARTWQKALFTIRSFALKLSDSELQPAKETLKASLFANLDNVTALCEDIGRQLLVYGRCIPPAELCQRIDAITANTVRQLVWDRLFFNKTAAVAIGPGLNESTSDIYSALQAQMISP